MPCAARAVLAAFRESARRTTDRLEVPVIKVAQFNAVIEQDAVT